MNQVLVVARLWSSLSLAEEILTDEVVRVTLLI